MHQSVQLPHQLRPQALAKLTKFDPLLLLQVMEKLSPSFEVIIPHLSLPLVYLVIDEKTIVLGCVLMFQVQ